MDEQQPGGNAWTGWDRTTTGTVPTQITPALGFGAPAGPATPLPGQARYRFEEVPGRRRQAGIAGAALVLVLIGGAGGFAVGHATAGTGTDAGTSTTGTTQGGPGQVFPGQGFPGQGSAGQGSAGQGSAGQGSAGQGSAGQGSAGQVLPGQDPGAQAPGTQDGTGQGSVIPDQSDQDSTTGQASTT